MQFSAVLLATAASMVSAQQFGIIAIRSGSDIQNSAVYSNGEKLVIGGTYQSTDYEVKDMLLLANGKPVQFGNGANIVDSEGAGTRDIEVNGQDYVYVPKFEWTACPAPEGADYVYTVETSSVCGEAGIPFAPRAMYKDEAATEEKPAETEAAPVETPAITEAPVPVPTGGAVVTANSTIVLTITDCGEGVECVTKPQPQPTQVEEAPEQANGAAALGVSAGIAGIAAVAMLL
ncbi:hypothetical protein B0I72DRAFT_140191 [Yarrowia lipolytica]|jgi:hypothetical protein|uniref:YALI0E26125p n=3 Tax=Yarrowia lipolytica TaxID=4952 RepID=Q6C4K0_YARLI|nr:YALI0E26125p [Yarrowia lipolytica CLIB122]KAB8280631.1 hypothetical protein BKA91DRAFT_141564 [Yarrowia lipolytica]KAE8170526.1 hypothetical protein BKA90DRAFT_140623 [Yarrowia lipolytica]KAJ8057387.1 hypothetical protein LXG23DRAFT_54090 [Yarrowia lipolytica]QNP99204.1 Hypothetical protein YALI2_E00520g [Yarrowia lipolytica]RDW27011.1 hypothetical protein B0I71DRAFT_129884 [Yarrowia lipolytica]|eukprot:XP_504412.1 YALI0E26125p [Yarrowia lipolytica CLIB122]